MPLSVGDLYSGAGGFSEGFRQAGFEIKWAVDNWAPAALTYNKNLGVEVFTDDIQSMDLRKLEKVDVIIGSPPCQGFSFANRAGNGDKKLGLSLVNKFFEIVEKKKPEYWIMENVPNTKRFLPIEEKDNEIIVENYDIKPTNLLILNSADYGVPQKRKRMFFGRFPVPKVTHYEQKGSQELLQKRWRSIKDVINSLPHPLDKNSPDFVTDPVYGFKIPGSMLTDQRLITYLTKDEVFKTRKSKVDHSFWGKMRFPDDVDRPSRTVTASVNTPGRHSIIIEDDRELVTNYRRPTIREMACFQSFPISYQFWSDFAGNKIRLVGNAVPPLVSYALAKRILEDKSFTAPKSVTHTLDFETPNQLPDNVLTAIGRIKKYAINRKFRDHFPGSISAHSTNSCRVDVDNRGEMPAVHPLSPSDSEVKHLTDWRTVLYTGYAKTVRNVRVDFNTATLLLKESLKQEVLDRDRAEKIIQKMPRLADEIPDATSLQAVRSNRTHLKMNPYNILEKMEKIVDKHASEKKYPWEIRVQTPKIIKISPEKGIPVRTVCQLLVCSWVTEIINHSDIWLKNNISKAYLVNIEKNEYNKETVFNKNQVLSILEDV